MEFVALGIASLIAGYVVSAAVEGLSNEPEAKNELERNTEYLTTELENKKKTAKENLENELNYLANEEADKEKQLTKQLENEKGYLKTELENALADNETAYGLAKDESDKQVDKAEKVTDQEERSTSNTFNSSVSSLSLQQRSRAANYNSEAMQAGSTKGSELSQAANSGIRAGSSLSQAIELEAATNQSQLDLQKDLQRKSDSNQLSSLFNDLGNAKFNIWNSRDTADQTRASWLAGGYNYEQNQLKIKGLNDSYNLNLAQLNDNYDLKMLSMRDEYGLKAWQLNNNYNTTLTSWEDAYNLQIKKWNDEYDNYMSGGNQWKRILTGAWSYGSALSTQAYQLSGLFK